MMTGVEFILLLAIACLAAQIFILQRHYTEKLSDQAAVLTFLLDLVIDKNIDGDQIDLLRGKIFSSSQ